MTALLDAPIRAPKPTTTSTPGVVGRELLLYGTDIKHSSESRAAELDRGEGISPAMRAQIAEAEAKANTVLRTTAKARAILSSPSMAKAIKIAGDAVKAEKKVEALTRTVEADNARHSEGRRRIASHVQRGHSARRGENQRTKGSRRAGSSSTTASADPGEPSEPEPRRCLCGCGEDISHLRAGAEFLNDCHSKRYRRRVKKLEEATPAETLPTTWADSDREEREGWRALGKPRRLILRPILVEEDVDPDGELQALMQGYFYPGGEGEFLHPISELRPELAKRHLGWPTAGMGRVAA